jgi:NTE family protein
VRALVLSGGGVKGAYQVGVLKKLLADDGRDYEVLCGISVGAINATYLAVTLKDGPKAAHAKLEELWGRVNNARVKRSWCLFGVLAAGWKQSVYDSKPLQRWIADELEGKTVTPGRKLRVVAVSWTSGESRVVDETSDGLAGWVAASSSFPVMLSPMDLDRQLWTDGGLRSVTPLGQAIEAGATEIDVVMCSDPFAKSPYDASGKPAVPALAHRALDIVTDQVMRADLQICGLKNRLAAHGNEFRNVEVRLFAPKGELASDPLDFDPAAIARMMKTGYEDGQRGPETLDAAVARGRRT